MGGTRYLLKLDQDLSRLGLVTVVENDPPTNDMFLVSDGTSICVGKFLPGTGHRVYCHDTDLVPLDSYVIGGGGNQHANGAAAVFAQGAFHLVAPMTLAPGINGDYNRFIFDRSWSVVAGRKTVLSDPGSLHMVPGLSELPGLGRFVLHYVRTSGDAGSIYRAVFDADWNLLGNEAVLEGTTYNRPHSVVVGDVLFLGYYGGGNFVSRYRIDTGPTEDVAWGGVGALAWGLLGMSLALGAGGCRCRP